MMSTFLRPSGKTRTEPTKMVVYLRTRPIMASFLDVMSVVRGTLSMERAGLNPADYDPNKYGYKYERR